MKVLINILFLVSIAIPGWSQDDAISRNPKAQEKIIAARIAFITERLELSPAEAERFWPIYREFNNKRQDIRQQFELARKNPAIDQPAEQRDKDLVELGFKLKQQELNLEKDYSTKILNVIPAQKLMALKKAEDDFRRLLIQQIQQRQMQEQRKQQFQERNEQRLKQRNN